jgi:hypothetical protein
MYEATSFICEHTAEYLLVPELKRILHNKFDTVVPIYPWASREGSNIAKALHKHDTFKMVGLYPRRPKLISVSSPEIIVKINAQILRGAQTGLRLGIPIIAGCPLARDFWELGENPNCVWVELNQDSTTDWELFLDPDQPLKYFNQMSTSMFLNEKDLLVYLDKYAKPIDIDKAISSFKEIKGAGFGASYSFLRFMGSYKPVYFLLKL